MAPSDDTVDDEPVLEEPEAATFVLELAMRLEAGTQAAATSAAWRVMVVIVDSISIRLNLREKSG